VSGFSRTVAEADVSFRGGRLQPARGHLIAPWGRLACASPLRMPGNRSDSVLPLAR